MKESVCAQGAPPANDAEDEINLPRVLPANDIGDEINVPRSITIEVDGPTEPQFDDSGISAETANAESAPGPSTEPSTEPSGTARNRRSRAQIRTARLDSRDFRPSWPIAIAALEQLSGWGVLALRLGILALIQQCVRELAEEHARPETIVRLRALTDALAHMPLEA